MFHKTLGIEQHFQTFISRLRHVMVTTGTNTVVLLQLPDYGSTRNKKGISAKGPSANRASSLNKRTDD